MKRRKLKTLLLGAVAVFAVLIVAYLLVIRPWHLTWGATDEEVSRTMLGDELNARPSFNGTRAVTVAARPEDIWPWLLQMGYKRAGFYSYDRLDNGGIPSAERIIPEYQDLKIGDMIPVAPDSYVEVLEMNREESMLWVFRVEGQWSNATWAWGLYEVDTGHTRLVSRLRVRYKWTRPSIVQMLLVDALELIMMRKCLLGIKSRAEAQARAPAARTR
jgi:hypothetical protein